ncbi:MAG: glycosyltransferase [Candidatus Methanomethylicia archaeon]
MPLISICIPIKNRFQYIRNLLNAIENLDYPKKKVKLIFVDDFSIDGTYEALVKWKNEVEEKYYKMVLMRERTNIPQARNLCIKNMEGDYLLFWDSDVIPPRDLLSEMISIMEENPTIGMIGADYEYDPSLKVRYKPIVNKETHAVYMGFTLIRREVFNVAGFFDENLSVGEDTEFGIRVTEKTDYKIVWAPRPVLHLKSPSDVKRRIRAWMAYNFHVRAEEYYKSFNRLPRILKIRLAYYIGLPLTIVLSLVLFITSVQVLAIMPLLYLVPSIYPLIKSRGLKEGIIVWLTFNLPTGLSLSYGFMYVVLKKLLRK